MLTQLLRRNGRFLLLPFCLALSACMTLVPLGSNSSQWASQLKTGDEVQVTLHDGSQQTFKVSAVETDALTGDGKRIAFADIQQLARNQIDGTRTTLLVIGVIAVAAAASSGGGGSDGDGGY